MFRVCICIASLWVLWRSKYTRDPDPCDPHVIRSDVGLPCRVASCFGTNRCGPLDPGLPKGSNVVPFWAVYYNPIAENES